MSQELDEIRALICSVQVCYPDVINRDINEVLRNKYAHFILIFDDFYFDDGIKKQLLCLRGTIAIFYSDIRYNIPVELWLQENHPYTAPICYVKPTLDMHISSNCPYVDLSGKIYVPYLRKWTSRESSLTKLTDNLSLVFSERSPVYSNKNKNLSVVSQKMLNTSNSHSSKSTNFNKKDQNDNKCKICMDNDIDCVFLECGHVVSCLNCASSFINCPVCRSKVDRIKKIFRS